jgi:hypothetical protein
LSGAKIRYAVDFVLSERAVPLVFAFLGGDDGQTGGEDEGTLGDNHD